MPMPVTAVRVPPGYKRAPYRKQGDRPATSTAEAGCDAEPPGSVLPSGSLPKMGGQGSAIFDPGQQGVTIKPDLPGNTLIEILAEKAQAIVGGLKEGGGVPERELLVRSLTQGVDIAQRHALSPDALALLFVKIRMAFDGLNTPNPPTAE
jgi:hypothetical protein